MDPLFQDVLADLLDDRLVSDIYLSPDEPLAFYRLGDFNRHPDVRVSLALMEEISREAHMNLDDRDADGHWFFRDMRLRLNLLRSKGRPQICMRPIIAEVPTFASCDFPENPALREMVLKSDSGLLIVSGPTGCGKSTTSAACIHERALARKKHAITFEDPIEFDYPRSLPSLVTQRELGSDVVDEVKALKSALRQHPDTLFVGEVRDQNTAFLLLNNASSGHFVMTSTHAATAYGSVEAVLKFLPRESWPWGCYMLSQHLQGVITQTMVIGPDRDRRYVLHEVLGRTDSAMSIIANAANDPNILKELAGEISLGGANGKHITREASLRRWRNLGVRLD